MRWFTAPTRKSGWLVVELEAENASYAHGRADAQGKPRVSLYGRRAAANAAEVERIAREMRFARYNCATLLRPGEYQLMQVEAPNVPAAELKAAMRWRLKDMLDYPVDEATIDVLEIPAQDDAPGRARSLYAVAARRETIRECVQRFETARIPLSVIDIPETAQRNIAALYEEEGRGLALLHAGEETSLLTVNFRAELLLVRRIDFGLRQFGAAEAQRNEALERVVLELQRTFDLLDRQYPQLSLTKLMVAPMPQDLGVAPYLQQNLGIRVETVDLSQALSFNVEEAPDPDAQWRLFHLLGASLRQ